MLFSPDLRDACITATARPIVLVANRIFLVVVLMVFLGRIKGAGRYDFGVDPGKTAALFQSRLAGFGRKPLCVALVKNSRAVLVADVAELPVLHGRIDVTPEIIQELFVCDLLRIVGYTHRLGMTGAAVADLFIGRVADRAAGIARLGIHHAGKLVEVRLYAPEAAAGKDGRGDFR